MFKFLTKAFLCEETLAQNHKPEFGDQSQISSFFLVKIATGSVL
jgi:hypothetical protein